MCHIHESTTTIHSGLPHLKAHKRHEAANVGTGVADPHPYSTHLGHSHGSFGRDFIKAVLNEISKCTIIPLPIPL